MRLIDGEGLDLQKLADALNVPPPQAGEAISPRIRFEQPWPQWLLIAVVLGGSALIIWLYRREGKASAFYKYLLAGIRICLLLLAGVHALRGRALGASVRACRT